MHGCRSALALLLVYSLLPASSADFQEGEYVPIARRGQYHGVRVDRKLTSSNIDCLTEASRS